MAELRPGRGLGHIAFQTDFGFAQEKHGLVICGVSGLPAVSNGRLSTQEVSPTSTNDILLKIEFILIFFYPATGMLTTSLH